VSVWKRLPGGGATTRNVACTVWPVSTAANEVGDVGVTDQPAGADRHRLTRFAARSPLSVKLTVAVTGWPAVTLVGTDSAIVPSGGASDGLWSELTR
jgi:hypothetical protein